MVKEDKEEKNFEEDEEIESSSSTSNKTKKKILIIILPILIVIGLVVSFYAVTTGEKKAEKPLNYSKVENSSTEGTGGSIILYDFQEVDCNLKSSGKDAKKIKIQLTVETPDSDKVEMLEAYRARINTLIIEHMIELTPEEIQTSEGLYWLKQDLLYRLNLILSPIKITNLNFKTFEIED